jgi:hypothetical protein
MAFKLERDKPIPTDRVKYPWRDMKVGDSFFVPGMAVSAIAGSVSGASSRGAGKFRCRAENGGVRIWKIA